MSILMQDLPDGNFRDVRARGEKKVAKGETAKALWVAARWALPSLATLQLTSALTAPSHPSCHCCSVANLTNLSYYMHDLKHHSS